MKKYFSIVLMGTALAMGMTGCMDDYDEPNVANYSIFCNNVGEVTATLDSVKTKYCSSNSGANEGSSSTNFEFKIEEDVVFEAVVVSNDGQYGALYQQIILRSLEGKAVIVNNQNIGHCIQLGVKNTCLYPYFAIGQKVRVNLKGLYVGVYSKVPKIGFPYFTSKGNHRLGPMPFEKCATNIQLIGTPDATCAECQPVDLTTGNVTSSVITMKYQYSPMLATIRGKFALGDDETILAPESLEDEGYAVDRDFNLSNSNLKMTVRTSTGNEISFLPMPKDEVTITGVLSYYSSWQMQFREPGDMKKTN